MQQTMVNIFPKLFVVVLDKCLELGLISTWNVKGRPIFTQITIRFHSEGMADQGEVT